MMGRKCPHPTLSRCGRRGKGRGQACLTCELGVPIPYAHQATWWNLRKERQGRHMAGTNHSEMAVVQCGQLVFAQSFHHGHHRGVDEANVGVSVLGTEMADSRVVL